MILPPDAAILGRLAVAVALVAVRSAYPDREAVAVPRRDRAASGRPKPSSGFPENALNLADSDPIHLGHLVHRHAVPHPGADARKLRPRDFRRLLGTDRRFGLFMTDRRRRQNR